MTGSNIYFIGMTSQQREIIQRLNRGQLHYTIADDMGMELSEVIEQEMIALSYVSDYLKTNERKAREYLKSIMILILTLLPSLDNTEEARVFRTTNRVVRTTRVRRQDIDEIAFIDV